MSAVPHGNESVVVVGDGGLLTWGLAFYLKAAGWQRVSLVGAAGAPRESAHARGVVDVHPPRLHRYDNIASSLQHYWFGALSYVKGTQLPPEHMRFAPGAWTDPSLLHWMSRMVFYTRETCLDAADVSAARLLQMQHRLLGELRPQLASALGTTEEKTAPVVSSSVTDMFLERSSFSEHRYRLVMHGKEGLKYDIDASKASSLASEAFPTFYRLKQHIRGTVRYASSPTYDLQALTASLREYCGVKFAGSVQRIPSDVASFSTESLSTVDPVSQKAQSMLLVNGVTLDDGSHIPCSAVVFANGGGIRRLLHAAGCYVLPPVYEAKAVFLDVNATREYMTGGIPERSVNIEHDVFLTRRDGSDKVRFGGMVTFGDETSPASFEPTAHPETQKEVATRYTTELEKYAAVSKFAFQPEQTYVDAVALTADGLPLIGRINPKGRFMTRPSNVYVCAGLGPAGVNAALSSAKLLADMTVGATPAIPAEPYLPDRFWLSG